MHDLESIKKELSTLPEWDKQICLQSYKGNKDYMLGCGKIKDMSIEESELTYPIFDLPIINEIMKVHSLVRTRVLRLDPKENYSYHKDPTKRFHLPIETNMKCFFVVEMKEIIQMPANGNHYILDTTREHTAVNAHRHKVRTHIVGVL